MEAALAVEGPDGRYREVDGPGYVRATVVGDPPFARFPVPGSSWGIVRAWAAVTPGEEAAEWRPLAAPRLVMVGARATLHLAEAELAVAAPEPSAAEGAPEAPPAPVPDGGRLGRWLREG